MTHLPPPEEKRSFVRAMFSAIAPRYDMLNTLLSLGIHHRWKDVTARLAELRPGDRAIDICAGTGDLALRMARHVGERGQVVAVDFAPPMLSLGRWKAAQAGMDGRVIFVQGDAEDLPVADGTFQAATVGFGIRNVARVDRALAEIFRVLARGGRILILEFSHPTTRGLRVLYDLYSHYVIPRVGYMIAGHDQAYHYLPSSIRNFPDQEAFARIIEQAGFAHVRYYNLTGGIAALHVGAKP
ncbi:MAG: bifunctional demethylmenaquinone methyltransferase/2-methoxy-6-polyprenyl-1,4-benzoquinol methylase UbiE [Armatimonadetes bacterium]|nr:bifunctional demethylmenaquinone methyltransferase/2-methoxy-6-polyprenyl-1,4-benzoquinol methylase UbiE [Armatimonadota bacterium]